MTASFVLVLIAAILSGLAAVRGFAGERTGAWYGGVDLVAAALCLFFVSLLVGGHG